MTIEITEVVEYLEKCIISIDKFVQVHIAIGFINWGLSKELNPSEKDEVLEGLKSVLMDKVQYQKDKLVNQTNL